MGTPLGAAEIGRKVGRVIARFKVAKHFDLEIGDGRFAYRRNQATIKAETIQAETIQAETIQAETIQAETGQAEAGQAEAGLDGLYVIRIGEPAARLSPADTVRAYIALAQVERLSRSLKGLEVLIRPIRHREERRAPDLIDMFSVPTPA